MLSIRIPVCSVGKLQHSVKGVERKKKEAIAVISPRGVKCVPQAGNSRHDHQQTLTSHTTIQIL